MNDAKLKKAEQVLRRYGATPTEAYAATVELLTDLRGLAEVRGFDFWEADLRSRDLHHSSRLGEYVE